MAYERIWVVFDKDDFTDEQFNNAINKAEKDGIETAWSNEAIELWFVLHFEYLQSAIHRDQYIEKLHKYFNEKGINNGQYVKNMPDIFQLLCEYGDVNQAIKNSQRLRDGYSDQKVKSKAKMNPCTTVDKIVDELIDYIS